MAWQEVTTDVGAKVGLTKYSVALKHGGARNATAGGDEMPPIPDFLRRVPA